MRKEWERCDSLEGFQIINALGGGTGSGMGANILTKLRRWDSTKIVQSYTVFPSESVSDNILEPYNTVLAFMS